MSEMNCNKASNIGHYLQRMHYIVRFLLEIETPDMNAVALYA